MLKGRELAAFRKQLLSWFRQFQRDLPWRRTRDPYCVWLSEIMLQQTRVAAVIPYYERFLERFPNLHALAAAPEEEVLLLWSGLGYYRRARNLHKAAKKIVSEHGGEFPSRLENVLALPGIGSYTAAAILSIAFEQKHAVLDGNVARVLARLGAVRGDLRESARWQALQKCADACLEPRSPGDWNQAMMELGATLCSPKSLQCLCCPVAQFCEARKLGIADLLPEKRKKRAIVEIRLAAAVLTDENGRTLLFPPPGEGNAEALTDHVPALTSNLWHFPMVMVNGNAVANLRGYLRKLQIQSRNGGFQFVAVDKVRHAVTYREITVEPFHISVKKLPRIKGAQQVALSEITALPVSNLTRKVARAALAASSTTT
ncbi:MAG TPA: A/G-specific adenine glycosylase [Candidatus Acidoferrum sp.]|nr:A/G-specific adenine glycosylase [Candidatus Acidoferrum sp.]